MTKINLEIEFEEIKSKKGVVLSYEKLKEALKQKAEMLISDGKKTAKEEDEIHEFEKFSIDFEKDMDRSLRFVFANCLSFDVSYYESLEYKSRIFRKENINYDRYSYASIMPTYTNLEYKDVFYALMKIGGEVFRNFIENPNNHKKIDLKYIKNNKHEITCSVLKLYTYKAKKLTKNSNSPVIEEEINIDSVYRALSMLNLTNYMFEYMIKNNNEGVGYTDDFFGFLPHFEMDVRNVYIELFMIYVNFLIDNNIKESIYATSKSRFEKYKSYILKQFEKSRSYSRYHIKKDVKMFHNCFGDVATIKGMKQIDDDFSNYNSFYEVRKYAIEAFSIVVGDSAEFEEFKNKEISNTHSWKL